MERRICTNLKPSSTVLEPAASGTSFATLFSCNMSDSSSEPNYSPDYEQVNDQEVSSWLHEPSATDESADNQETPSYLHEPYAAVDCDDVYNVSWGESNVQKEECEDEYDDVKAINNEADGGSVPRIIVTYHPETAIVTIL